MPKFGPFRPILMILILLSIPSSLFGMDLKRSGVWEYSVGEREQTARDADTLRYAKLPRFDQLQELVPGKVGYLWVRTAFRIPDSLMDNELGLMLARTMVADEVYLNGERIGESGRFPPRFFGDWNHDRYCLFQAGSVARVDTLLFKLYVHHEGALIGPVSIDSASRTYAEFRFHRFFGRDVNLLAAVLLCLIAIYHFMIHVQRPKDRYNLWYALLGFSFAVYLSNFFATDIPGFMALDLSYLAFQKIVFAALNLSLLALGLFVSAFLERREPEWLRHGFVALMLAIIVLFLGAPDFRTLQLFRSAHPLMCLVPALFLTIVLIRASLRKQEGVGSVLIGLFPLFCAALFDLVVRDVMRIPGFYLTSLGVPAFIVAILFILSIRFVHIANEEDRLNQELEIDVYVRTNQLKEANLRLESALQELKDANTRLESLAVTDSLSRTFNRRAFDLRFEEECARARRNRTSLSLLMIDIDFFKRINDEHGHLCGDQCIVSLASSLQGFLRRPSDILARYGGEEFVVLLPETDRGGAGKIAESMRAGIEAMEIAYEDVRLHLTVSIGVATSRFDSVHMPETLVAHADTALYKAKSQGRNQVAFAEDPAEPKADVF